MANAQAQGRVVEDATTQLLMLMLWLRHCAIDVLSSWRQRCAYDVAKGGSEDVRTRVQQDLISSEKFETKYLIT